MFSLHCGVNHFMVYHTPVFVQISQMLVCIEGSCSRVSLSLFLQEPMLRTYVILLTNLIMKKICCLEHWCIPKSTGIPILGCEKRDKTTNKIRILRFYYFWWLCTLRFAMYTLQARMQEGANAPPPPPPPSRAVKVRLERTY